MLRIFIMLFWYFMGFLNDDVIVEGDLGGDIGVWGCLLVGK